MSKWSRLRVKTLSALVIAAASCVLVLPAGASAATVVNGDFETGTLSGWQVYNSTPEGDWYVFSAAEAAAASSGPTPFGFYPPSGNYGAYTYEEFPDTAILYQDVALEPLFTHQLSMTLGYVSEAPLVASNTLAVDPEVPPSYPNQQLRVDVMKPTAPIESLNPADILATVFATKTGDPPTMAPTPLSANLSAFAGQTVRIRIANAAGDGEFNTSLDNVSITSTPLPPPPPSNEFSRGKLTLNRSNGTGKLAIKVPGPGTLVGVDARAATAAASISATTKPKRIKKAKLSPTAAGIVQLPLRPTAAGRKTLRETGRLQVKVRVTFTPTGGTAKTHSYSIALRKTLK